MRSSAAARNANWDGGGEVGTAAKGRQGGKGGKKGPNDDDMYVRGGSTSSTEEEDGEEENERTRLNGGKKQNGGGGGGRSRGGTRHRQQQQQQQQPQQQQDLYHNPDSPVGSEENAYAEANLLMAGASAGVGGGNGRYEEYDSDLYANGDPLSAGSSSNEMVHPQHLQHLQHQVQGQHPHRHNGRGYQEQHPGGGNRYASLVGSRHSNVREQLCKTYA